MTPISRKGKATIKRNALSAAIKSQNFLGSCAALALSASMIVPTVKAEDEVGFTLEEVVVTARKRDESLQDAPLSIQALGTQALQDLGIASFDDYALMLPSLSYQSAGPGLSQIYMRGASDGGDGNASGAQPSVAIYLDEQPVTAIGRNLDIHVYDIARVESLAGPQGTLYGANSQGGALRIITNKPDPSQFEAGFDVGYSTTDGGEDSHSIEGYVNQPIGDNAALRVVAWKKHDGGYIDNVPGTRTYALIDGGGSTNFVTENNDSFVEDDFNDLDNEGARAALKVDLNESWTVTGSVLTQKQETEGVWWHDPENGSGEVDDYETQVFNPANSEDDFTQFAFTVEGDLGFGSLTYAGSFMDREVEYNNDYSDYADYNSTSWIQYYSCNYYEISGPATADCTSNNIFYEEENDYSRDSHELRLQSQLEGPFQFLAGLYYEKATHEYRQEWIMPGMAEGPDFNLLDKEDLWYLTDQKRVDEQKAVFGEVSYDFTDSLTATLGARYFENESTLEGITGYGVQLPGVPIVNVNSSMDDSDSIFKVNISYAIDEDKNIYFTWSEGYRPGGINRDETAIVAGDFAPDFLTNWEFGWKTTLMDGRMRWNGAAYLMEWEDMQFTRYDESFGSPVGLTLNVGEAEIKGVETDLTFMLTENLTVSAAMAYNQAELVEDFVIGTNSSPDGTELPHVPELKYNLNARYQFNLGGYDAFAQVVYAFVDDSYSDIFKHTDGDTSIDQRQTQDSYENINLSAGFETETWGVDLYVNNLTNETPQITRSTVSYDSSYVTNRPRTVGVTYRMRF